MTEGVAFARTAQRNTSAGRRMLVALGLLLVVLLGLLVLLFVGFEVGPVALAMGPVLAVVPVPLYVFTALRVDRFEPEAVRLLAGAFCWGATAATFIALVLNTTGRAVVGSSFGSKVGVIYGHSISAPVVEEPAKGGVLFALFRWRRWEFDGLLDGLVFAAMVGLGFAMTENIVYYGRAATEGGGPLAATFFIRGVTSPFAHPLFTAMTGLGLGVAATAAGGARRLVAPVAGLAAAMLLHSLWNHVGARVGRGRVLRRVLPVHVPGVRGADRGDRHRAAARGPDDRRAPPARGCPRRAQSRRRDGPVRTRRAPPTAPGRAPRRRRRAPGLPRLGEDGHRARLPAPSRPARAVHRQR
jgi:protease PrsW